MVRPRLSLLAAVSAAVLAACGSNALVTTERADLVVDDLSPSTVPERDPADPSEPAPAPADPATPDEPPQPLDPESIDREAIDFGSDKTPREYDDFLLAAITDIQLWWAEQYPAIYGSPFEPLAGKVYAAYPSRPDDLPGCGTPRTTYDEIQQFGAFYCGVGDYIIYDDGDAGLLTGLAEELGPVSIAVVLAHEFGHAIQLRTGDLDAGVATIVTEQQADCFAGAWISRVWSGESPGLQIGDADVRASLIAMLEVRDPVGLDQFAPGGHGAGFDRVGAFQEGFNLGPARCSELIEDPLPLVPNQFTGQDDFANEGNAAFGFGEEDLLGFLPADLNLYWDVQLDDTITGFTALTLVSAASVDDIDCDDLLAGFERGTALCASTGVVYLNEPKARSLYSESELGDFSVGYLLGVAWAEGVQEALGTGLAGEERALLDDCLTGAWVRTVIPVDFALPTPRAEGRTSVVSPGDLDEAVQTAILFGDLDAEDNEIGSAFEKIDAFRTGVIGGLEACNI